MKDFMTHLADKVWPKGKRYGIENEKFDLKIFVCFSFLL